MPLYLFRLVYVRVSLGRSVFLTSCHSVATDEEEEDIVVSSS